MYIYRYIPDMSTMESILRDGCMMDPYEYIQLVLNQRGVTLDSEVVWPIPEIIFKF